MRFNCTHVFTLEASDTEDFEEKLRRYRELIREISLTLDIGYAAGYMLGRPARSSG